MHRSPNWTDKEYQERRLKERERYYGSTAYKYKPRRWTAADDKILSSFEGVDRELSDILKRSVKAIQHRRAKLKRDSNE